MTDQSQESQSLKIVLSQKQTDAIRLLEDQITTEIVYGGGAGSGKSILGTWWLLKSCIKFNETRWVMGRSKLKTLKETTLKSLFDVMKMTGISKDFYQYNQTSGIIHFYNGSEIILKDLFAYPSDPDFDELGSLEITGAFVDEASQITVKAKNILKSRIRYKLDEYNIIPKMLMTCNPTRNFLYAEFYRPFIEGTLPEGRAFVHALLSDNPNISEHYRNNLLGLDQESKERLLFGNWQYIDDPTKLCEIDRIIDLWTNNHVRAGAKYISCDVARFGRDNTVIIVWDGLIVVRIVTKGRTSVSETADMILQLKKDYGVPMSHIVIDDDGVGGGVVDLLPGCYGFIANKKAIAGSGKNYANLKSQCSFTLAEYINDGKIWIKLTSNRDLIIEELEQLKKRKEETDDKLSIIRKEEVKEILGRSPDYSDAIMMRMLFQVMHVGGIRRIN